MVAKLLDYFADVLLERKLTQERQLLTLAKNEYGRDWEWAYHQLLNNDGKLPSKGVQL